MRWARIRCIMSEEGMRVVSVPFDVIESFMVHPIIIVASFVMSMCVVLRVKRSVGRGTRSMAWATPSRRRILSREERY